MRDLGKWPRLLVAGAEVTQSQANEILVRTSHWLPCTNDADWELVIAEVAGISLERHRFPDFASIRRFEQRHHVLDLSYLHNDRIASAWIDGPHGWCDWNGNIGCSTWNIGKWPTVEAVTEDWEIIAAAFPYLTVTAQLVGQEGDDDHPAVEWRIAAGQVELVTEPERFVRPVDNIDFEAAAYGIRYDRFRERGVDRERLQQAIDQVRAAFPPESTQ